MRELTADMRRKVSSFSLRMAARNDPMHSGSHLRQTARIAIRLARSEGASEDACWAAGMLHDICKERSGDHAALGASEASSFLRAQGIPQAFVEKVCDAISFHNKEFRGGPLERQILWDADKLPLMAPRGFMNRMLPYWEMKEGKGAGLGTAEAEYLFYRERFHTRSALLAVRRQAQRMERMISRLKGRRAGAHL